MKVTVENISPVKKKLSIEIEPEIVAKEIDKTLAEVGKKAKIAGFRPGKAPKNVVEKHYAGEIQSEALNRLLSTHYLQALNEQKLNPVDTPAIDNISALEKGSPLSFHATIEVRPAIELGTYDGIEVKEQDITVADQEVDKTVGHIREVYAQLEVVEGRAVENTDTAVIDFEGIIDGKPIEGTKATDYLLAFGTKSLIPGFEEQLLGMTKGETRNITVTFPADYNNKDLAGKEASFTVLLKEIKKKVLPELNDELAKEIGEYKTLDELKEAIKKDIESRKQNEQSNAQREEILSKLVESHSFEVPPTMVDLELEALARHHAAQMARRGVDVMKTFDVKKFREESTPLAVKRVKGTLILDEIGQKEKVEITDQELTTALTTMAKASGKTVDDLKKYYEKHDGNLDGLRDSLKQEKTLGLLLSRAKKGYN